jgi:hypothetical protein
VRHLGSVLLALLVAPLGFVLTGRGLGGLAEVAAEAPQAEQTDYFAIITASAALGLAGLGLALLVMARLAPLGPALAGAGYLAIGVWALVDREQMLDAFPGDLVGLADDRLTLAATVAPLLAVPLLVTLFIPRRWRRPDRRSQLIERLYRPPVRRPYRPPGSPPAKSPAPAAAAPPRPTPTLTQPTVPQPAVPTTPVPPADPRRGP